MSKYKNIATIGKSIRRPGNHNFSASNVSSNSVGTSIDPVISIDHFEIRKATFPPHPHAVFSAVTYLFEDGEGEFVSRDSTGGHHVSKPGGVIWNVAGSGVMHEEYPKVQGELSHGLQMFVNLSSANKMQKPHVFFVDGPDIPTFSKDGVKVRVIAGEFQNMKAKIQPPGNITYLDIFLSPRKEVEIPLSANNRTLLYFISGGAKVGNEDKWLEAPDASILTDDADTVFIKTEESEVHLVLVAGEPTNEPIIAHGPFVMNTMEQINDAIIRYQNGSMGYLASTNSF